MSLSLSLSLSLSFLLLRNDDVNETCLCNKYTTLCFSIIELNISLERHRGFLVYLFGTSDLCIQQDIDTDKVCL